MFKHIKIQIGILAITACCFVTFCTKGPVAAGDVTETGNAKVSGIIVDSLGHGAPHVRVMLVPTSYDPIMSKPLPSSHFDTTTTQGTYSFSHIDSGTYTIEAMHIGNKTQVFHFEISTATINRPDSIDTLRQTGTIKLNAPPNGFTEGYIYIPGTTRSVFVGKNATNAILDSIPSGILPSVCYGAINGTPINTRHNVTVLSNETITLNNIDWQYSKQIAFNTTISGATINSTITNIPILIKLSKATFDFSLANVNGNDIRFTSRNDKILPYDIERWDRNTSTAEIWVNVDTIKPNDSLQFITMYFGNASSTTNANGSKVFDTSYNFAGVWHLNDTPDSTQASINDKTSNNYNGHPKGGMNDGNCIEGIVGRALHFNGQENNIMIKRPVQDDFTIAFWMKADSSSRTGTQWWDGDGLIDGDINNVSPQNDFGVSYLNNKPAFGSCCDSTLSADIAVNDGKWHYIVATREKVSGLKSIFVDGKNAGSQIGITSSLTGSDSLCIGKVLANTTAFKGSLDEIQISNTVRSKDWILLNYVNQIQNDVLIKIKNQ